MKTEAQMVLVKCKCLTYRCWKMAFNTVHCTVPCLRVGKCSRVMYNLLEVLDNFCKIFSVCQVYFANAGIAAVLSSADYIPVECHHEQVWSVCRTTPWCDYLSVPGHMSICAMMQAAIYAR